MRALAFVSLLLLLGCETSPPSTCGPATCGGCCLADGTCVGGGTFDACGLGGARCTPCAPGLQCLLGQCSGSNVGGGGGSAGGGSGGGSATGGGTGGGSAIDDGGVASCDAPLTGCGGACFDLTRDTRHCGVCGVACGSGQLCVNGACVGYPTCDASRPCPPGSYCAQPGLCLPGCDAADQCPQPGACNSASHTCVCASGRQACGQRCVEPNDVTACGVTCARCTAPASGTPVCNGGACDFTCSTGTHRCGATCAADDSVMSCGARCEPCVAPANATSTCDGTSCGFVCQPGFHRCGDQCVSDTSTATCGTACTPCATDPNGSATCNGTSCGLSCNATFRECDAACRACPTTGVMTTGCSGAACVASACTGGYRLCDGACGQCPTTGVTATTCSGTACVASTCSANYRLCNETCASCPTQNVTATACNSAACVATACAPGFKVCSTGCCPKWTVVPITDAAYGISTGLVFTPSGDAILAYPATGSKVSLKRWSGGTTFTTQTTPFTAVAAFSLALAANGQPALALITSSSQQLSYTEFNGSTWTTAPVFNAAPDNATIYGARLLFAPSGEPVIVAFVQTSSASTLRVWRRTGGTWNSEEVAASSLGSRNVQATFAGSELHLIWSTPVSIYRDQHARFINAAWSSTAINTSNAFGNGLAVNGTSLDLFTVTSLGGSGVWVRLWNTVWNGASYGQSTVIEELNQPTATSGGGAWMHVASRASVTHLAYARQPPYSDLRHAWRTGTTGAFNTETIEALSPSDISIAVGPGGDAAVLYRSSTTPMGVRFAFER